MYKFNMPSKIAEVLIQCMEKKAIYPTANNDPPHNTAFEIQDTEGLKVLGECLREMNEKFWGG